MHEAAIKLIEKLRDEAEAGWDIPEDEEAREEFLSEMDSEDYGRYQAEGDVFDRVLVALRDEPTMKELFQTHYPGGIAEHPDA